jgi:hypothetical protein
VSDASQLPRFCPWCGSMVEYEGHEHEPRFETLAEEARRRGEEPPPLPKRVEDILAGDSFVGACSSCRTVSHVIGHHAAD